MAVARHLLLEPDREEMAIVQACQVVLEGQLLQPGVRLLVLANTPFRSALFHVAASTSSPKSCRHSRIIWSDSSVGCHSASFISGDELGTRHQRLSRSTISSVSGTSVSTSLSHATADGAGSADRSALDWLPASHSSAAEGS